jgi:hypothetical protein
MTIALVIALILSDLFTFPRFRFDFLIQETVKYTNYAASVNWKMTRREYPADNWNCTKPFFGL